MRWSQFLTNLQTFRPTTLLKRDSSTGAFLWTLHIFTENLFWKAPVNKLFITCENNKWDHSAVRIFKSKKSIRLISVLKIFLKIIHLLHVSITLDMHEWYETFNPGLRKNNTSCKFSFCQWNCNSIVAHSFLKLLLLKAYNIQHKFDMICFSETFLDFSIPTNVKKINMKGYKLIRAGNANDSKNRLSGHL